MRLHTLLEALPGVDLTLMACVPNVEVYGVEEDSRRVESGDLFVARRGTATDGRNFIDDARRRGAVAVVAEGDAGGVGLPVVAVANAAEAASWLANRLQGDPSRGLRVLGVTGTNGKTTVSFLMRHLVARLAGPCGLIGTCLTDDGSRTRAASMTTPSAGEVAKLLATMRDKGCHGAAMEVSSHALDQRRVAGVTFAGAAFTNLSGDHLDYHGTFENYAAAKARLFAQLPDGAPAVVNAADPMSDRMLADSRGRAIRFGVDRQADYVMSDLASDASGSRFTLTTPNGSAGGTMRLVGLHNVENALAAAALVGEVFGFKADDIVAGLADAPAAPGRLEPVHDGDPVAVFVDYAHTDDALDNVLRALRPITAGRLFVVFGCGGDRDKTKRPRMAAVAERLADEIVVTSDNPRTESPTAIIDDVLAGLADPRRATVEPDRRLAIELALAAASPGDTVLVAGKGHETYQIVGDTRLPFDDADVCRRALARRFAATAQAA